MLQLQQGTAQREVWAGLGSPHVLSSGFFKYFPCVSLSGANLLNLALCPQSWSCPKGCFSQRDFILTWRNCSSSGTMTRLKESAHGQREDAIFLGLAIFLMKKSLDFCTLRDNIFQDIFPCFCLQLLWHLSRLVLALAVRDRALGFRSGLRKLNILAV